MASDDRNRREKSPYWSNYRPRPIKSLTVPRTLTDICYSICNIALLVAAIVALVYLVKFLTDDPLYEYGEHLLSLRFYRQLIYIIVIVPLVILVPLFNAFSSFIITKQLRTEFGESLTKVNEYRCCDVLWYRSNFSHRVPMSCLEPDNGLFDVPHKQTCSDVLAGLVSHRCFVIAVCLIIILVALVCLISIDLLECTALNGREYQVRDDHHLDSTAEKSTKPMLNGRAKYPLTAYGDAASKQRHQQQTRVKSPVSDISSSSGVVRAHRVVTTDDDSDDINRVCEPIDVGQVSDDDDDDQVREKFRRYDAARTTSTTAASGSLSSRQSGAPLLTTRSTDEDCGGDYRRFAAAADDDDDDDDSGDFQHRYQASFRATPGPSRAGQHSPAMASRLANSAVLARANLLHTEPVRPKSPVFLVDESAQRPAPAAGSPASSSSSQVSSPALDSQRPQQRPQTRYLHSVLKKQTVSEMTSSERHQHRSRSIWEPASGSSSSKNQANDFVDSAPRGNTSNTGASTGTGNASDPDDSERFRAHQRDLQRDLQTRRSLLSVRFAD